MKYLVFNIKVILLLLILYFLTTSYKIPPGFTQTMSNSSYIIQMGNLNSIAGKPTGSGYKLSITSGETAPGFYSGTNYKVRAGFQYINTLIPFTFSISNTNIDFGTIIPTNPVTRSNTLTVSFGSAYGYVVTVSENHPLRINSTGIQIPDTTCDAGTCTTSVARTWTNSLTYGFGYNCSNVTGTDCAADFTDSTYYRPFIASPSAVTVMSSSNVSSSRQSQITYKVNVSGTQTAGLYTNVINFIAVPTF